MKYTYFLIISLLILSGCSENQKPALRQGAFYTEEQGAAELKKLESMYSSREQWEPRKQMLKENILKGMNLSPLPTRTPLNPIISEKRIHDGYSVQNVAIETIPGFFLCGNLYRPLDETKKYPGILCPHGHLTVIHLEHGDASTLIYRNVVPLLPGWALLSSATACMGGAESRANNSTLLQ